MKKMIFFFRRDGNSLEAILKVLSLKANKFLSPDKLAGMKQVPSKVMILQNKQVKLCATS